MKRLYLLTVLSLAALSANAECTLTSVRDGDVARKFRQYGGWVFQNFDHVCEKLNRANARLQINANASVLNNQSIGWAVLTVVDRDTGIGTSDYASMNTQVNSYASQNKADEIMVAAINAAADEWTSIDKALASLDEERRKARKARSK